MRTFKTWWQITTRREKLAELACDLVVLGMILFIVWLAARGEPLFSSGGLALTVVLGLLFLGLVLPMGIGRKVRRQKKEEAITNLVRERLGAKDPTVAGDVRGVIVNYTDGQTNHRVLVSQEGDIWILHAIT